MRAYRAILAFAAVTAGAPDLSSGFPLVAQSWQELGPSERYKALRNYQQHERRPEEDRRGIEQRFERWQQMSPDERSRIRQNYERLQQMPPQDRERFQKKYEKWRQRGGPR
jgi:hypothetical protein